MQYAMKETSSNSSKWFHFYDTEKQRSGAQSEGAEGGTCGMHWVVCDELYLLLDGDHITLHLLKLRN